MFHNKTTVILSDPCIALFVKYFLISFLYSLLDFSEDSSAKFPFNKDKLKVFDGFKKDDATLFFNGVVSLSEFVCITKGSLYPIKTLAPFSMVFFLIFLQSYRIKNKLFPF